MKPTVYYVNLHSEVKVGEYAVIVPVNYPVRASNGERLIVGPVTDIVPVVGSGYPVFATRTKNYVPVHSICGGMTNGIKHREG